jgi:hypothetical protein
MHVCHIFILVAVALIVIGAAAFLTHRDERSARFKEKFVFEEDERISKSDLP